ncbi:hypothetical protein [Leucobacter sp. GX24907]
MSIRRKLAATGATAALVLGGVFAATPAHAASWSQLYDTRNGCLSGTDKKLHTLKLQGAKNIKIRYKCKQQKAQSGRYIYGSAMSWK